jgi:hypothetical protein
LRFLSTELKLTTVDFITTPLSGIVSVGLEGEEAFLRKRFNELDENIRSMVYFCYRPHPKALLHYNRFILILKLNPSFMRCMTSASAALSVRNVLG